MQDVYVLLGSNLGDRLALISRATSMIEIEIGEVVARSALYETASWGNTDQPDFINQALQLRTNLSAQEVLEKSLGIETTLGRQREEKWGSRTIDIDLLFYGSSVINESNLVIPHPHLHERAFALIPLSEVAPELIHPIFGQSVSVLCRNLEDRLSVKRINNP